MAPPTGHGTDSAERGSSISGGSDGSRGLIACARRYARRAPSMSPWRTARSPSSAQVTYSPRLLVRGRAQRRPRGVPLAEPGERGGLHVVAGEHLGIEPERAVGVAQRAGGIRGERTAGAVDEPLRHRLPREAHRRHRDHQRDGEGKHPGAPGRPRRRHGDHAHRADEHRGGDAGQQVQPVHARLHQPRGRHAEARDRDGPDVGGVAGEPARGEPRPGDAGEDDEQQREADGAELAQQLEPDGVRLADVLRDAALGEPAAVVVAGAEPAHRLVLEGVPRDPPVVVAVAGAGDEPRVALLRRRGAERDERVVLRPRRVRDAPGRRGADPRRDQHAHRERARRRALQLRLGRIQPLEPDRCAPHRRRERREHRQPLRGAVDDLGRHLATVGLRVDVEQRRRRGGHRGADDEQRPAAPRAPGHREHDHEQREAGGERHAARLREHREAGQQRRAARARARDDGLAPLGRRGAQPRAEHEVAAHAVDVAQRLVQPAGQEEVRRARARHPHEHDEADSDGGERERRQHRERRAAAADRARPASAPSPA